MCALGLCENKNGDAAASTVAATEAFCSWILWTEKPRQGLLLTLHSPCWQILRIPATPSPCSLQCTLRAERGGEGSCQGWREAAGQGPWTSAQAQGVSLDLNFPYSSLSSRGIKASHSNPPPHPLPIVFDCGWLCALVCTHKKAVLWAAQLVAFFCLHPVASPTPTCQGSWEAYVFSHRSLSYMFELLGRLKKKYWCLIPTQD